MTKTVSISDSVLKQCAIKASRAADLSIDDVRGLINWANCQQESYWRELNLQEVLNVYRVSGEYISFEDWVIEDRMAAVAAYNRAVDPAHAWKD